MLEHLPEGSLFGYCPGQIQPAKAFAEILREGLVSLVCAGLTHGFFNLSPSSFRGIAAGHWGGVCNDVYYNYYCFDNFGSACQASGLVRYLPDGNTAGKNIYLEKKNFLTAMARAAKIVHCYNFH